MASWSDTIDGKEIIVISSDSEEDDPISKDKEIISISSDSENDEWIQNINDDHTGRGEKRKTLSDSEEEPFMKRNNAFSNDTDPAPTDEGSTTEDEGSTTEDELEQTGQGKKRKAETQDVEQEEYYRIKTVKEQYSEKFKTTGKNYRVQFNNTLDNVDLLQSQTRTYDIFDRLIQDVTKGMKPTDQVRFMLDSKQLQFPITPIFLPIGGIDDRESVFPG